MLRWTVGLLIAANALYFAWTQGYLEGLGFAPRIEREPERVHQQVNPEAIRLLNGMPGSVNEAPSSSNAETSASGTSPEPRSGASQSSTASDAPVITEAPIAPETNELQAADVAVCWIADGLSVEQGRALGQVLETRVDLQGLYDLKPAKGGGRWIVYMGKLGEDTMARKKKELRELKVEYREVRNSPLAPGLALGTFSTEEAAERGLDIVAKKGVRTARVAQERPEKDYVTLTLGSVTTQQKAEFDAVLTAFEGAELERCSPAEE